MFSLLAQQSRNQKSLRSFASLCLRARQEIRCAFWRERRAGRCEAPRRRRCRCASSRSGNKADARPPPRPSGLRPAGPLAVLLAPYIPHRVCSLLAPCQRAWGPAAKCTPYFLTGPKVQILCRLERILLRGFFALFASSRLIPDGAFTAKTRRTQRKR